MSYSYRTRSIGQGATPTSEHILFKSMSGLALAKGDASDLTDTTLDAENGGRVGWWWSNPHSRSEAVGYLAMPSDLPRNARVFQAVAHLIGSTTVAASQSFTSDDYLVDPTVEIWPVRRVLATDLAGLTAANYTTGQAWQERLVRFGVGSDSDAAFIGSFEYSTSERDYDVDLRAEFQRCLDFGEPLQIVFRARWGDPTGTEEAWFNWTNPKGFATHAAELHTWFELAFRNSLEIYGATSAGALNQADLKDVASAGLQQHLYLGTPPRGSETSPEKFYARNELTVGQPAVVIHAGRARVGSIDHSGVAGSGRVGAIRPYETASGQATPTGTWRLEFTSATLFSAFFTPDATGIEAAAGTGFDITAGITITYGGLNALSIPFVASGANWRGTFADDDIITFESRGDLHTAAAPLANLDDVNLAPHAAGNRSAANTGVKRTAAGAVTQQLNREDARTIANSGSSAAVIADVTDGGSWTHAKVPDPEAFTAGTWATLANYDAETETDVPAGTYVEHVYVEAVYALDDATYPGQVRLAASAGGGSLTNTAEFDATSVLTSGVWLGYMEAPDQAFLAVAASTTSQNIELAESLTATSGTITLLDPATGTTETRVIQSGGGTSFVLTSAPSYAYPAGSLVFFAAETTSNVPFFLTAAPDVAAARGRKQAYVVAESISVV